MNYISKKNWDYFTGCLISSFFPKLSLPHGFSIRGKVERLWVLQSMNARVQAAYQLREPERCPVDRFTNVKRAQSIWLTSARLPCRLSRSIPILLNDDRQEASPALHRHRQTDPVPFCTVEQLHPSKLHLPLRVEAQAPVSFCSSDHLATRQINTTLVKTRLLSAVHWSLPPKVDWKGSLELQKRSLQFLNQAFNSRFSGNSWFPLQVPECLTPSSRKKVRLLFFCFLTLEVQMTISDMNKHGM